MFLNRVYKIAIISTILVGIVLSILLKTLVSNKEPDSIITPINIPQPTAAPIKEKTLKIKTPVFKEKEPSLIKESISSPKVTNQSTFKKRFVKIQIKNSDEKITSFFDKNGDLFLKSGDLKAKGYDLKGKTGDFLNIKNIAFLFLNDDFQIQERRNKSLDSTNTEKEEITRFVVDNDGIKYKAGINVKLKDSKVQVNIPFVFNYNKYEIIGNYNKSNNVLKSLTFNYKKDDQRLSFGKVQTNSQQIYSGNVYGILHSNKEYKPFERINKTEYYFLLTDESTIKVYKNEEIVHDGVYSNRYELDLLEYIKYEEDYELTIEIINETTFEKSIHKITDKDHIQKKSHKSYEFLYGKDKDGKLRWLGQYEQDGINYRANISKEEQIYGVQIKNFEVNVSNSQINGVGLYIKQYKSGVLKNSDTYFSNSFVFKHKYKGISDMSISMGIKNKIFKDLTHQFKIKVDFLAKRIMPSAGLRYKYKEYNLSANVDIKRYPEIKLAITKRGDFLNGILNSSIVHEDGELKLSTSTTVDGTRVSVNRDNQGYSGSVSRNINYKDFKFDVNYNTRGNLSAYGKVGFYGDKDSISRTSSTSMKQEKIVIFNSDRLIGLKILNKGRRCELRKGTECSFTMRKQEELFYFDDTEIGHREEIEETWRVTQKVIEFKGAGTKKINIKSKKKFLFVGRSPEKANILFFKGEMILPNKKGIFYIELSAGEYDIKGKEEEYVFKVIPQEKWKLPEYNITVK